MTDPADTLAHVRAAQVQALSRTQRSNWLRSKGWLTDSEDE
jgi:hypothetical protein